MFTFTALWSGRYDSHYSRFTKKKRKTKKKKVKYIKRVEASTKECSLCKINFQLEELRFNAFLCVNEEPLCEEELNAKFGLHYRHKQISYAL